MLAHMVCVLCTTSNEGIGLSFPDYDNCWLTGYVVYTDIFEEFCGGVGSTESLLGS